MYQGEIVKHLDAHSRHHGLIYLILEEVAGQKAHDRSQSLAAQMPGYTSQGQRASQPRVMTPRLAMALSESSLRYSLCEHFCFFVIR